MFCVAYKLRGLWITPNSSTPSTEFHNGDEEGNFLELPKNKGQQQKRNDGVKVGALAVSYAVLHLEQEKQQWPGGCLKDDEFSLLNENIN